MIDWYGVAGLLTFYSLILLVGLWASTKQKNNGEEEVMLAGRSIGPTIGTLTLIATWAGGSYFTGIAEVLFTSGLVWCQTPLGYSLTLSAGALLFAKPMREAGYVTMLDPFQEAYGSKMVGLLFIPALFGDMLFLASLLSALGVSLKVILDISEIWSITISTTFATIYTISGGLYSVTYTDVLQLIFVVLGLGISVPFALSNVPLYAKDLNASVVPPEAINWVGYVPPKDYIPWTEQMFILIFGGIPSQSYFQRILSLDPSVDALNIASISSIFCFLLAIPAGLFGVVAKLIDWTKVPGYDKPFDMSDASSVLPLVLRYVTPNWVAFFGLGAVSASVMSSADSLILSSSTLFTRNIYKFSFRPKASETELIWVLRLSIIASSCIACTIALSSASIYYLSVVCSDITYVILLPQLLLVIYAAKMVNSYGSLISVVVGIFFGLSAGEPNLGLPPLIKYPGFEPDTGRQLFPYKTLAMLLSAFTHLVFSKLMTYLFYNRILDATKWDILKAFPDLWDIPNKPQEPAILEILETKRLKEDMTKNASKADTRYTYTHERTTECTYYIT